MDHERVAALHDGKLGAHERHELLAAIAADDDESWVFAETAAVMAELEAAHAASPTDADQDDDTGAPQTFAADPPPAPIANSKADAEGVIPLATRRSADTSTSGAGDEAAAGEDDGVISIESRRRPASRKWMAWGAIAAGLAAIGITAALLQRSSDRGLDPASVVAVLDRGAEPGLARGWESPWPVTRGIEDDLAEDQVAVRVGSHLFDLELAAAKNDTSALHDLSRKVVALLQQVSGGGELSKPFEQLAAGAGDVRGLLEEGRKGVRLRLAEEWVDLGIWAEGARTAAVRRDAGFFRSPGLERTLQRVEALPEADASTKEVIQAVRAALPASGRTTNWNELQHSLERLLRVAGASYDDPLAPAPSP